MSKTVRIDKFLWSVRIFKTRTKATEACKTGKVRINEASVRPAKGVAINDTIQLRRGPLNFTYKVKELLGKRVGAKLVDDYVKDLTTKEELEKLEVLRLSHTRWRDRGQGRPTKKDRREIDEFDGQDADNLIDWDDWGDLEDWTDDLT